MAGAADAAGVAGVYDGEGGAASSDGCADRVGPEAAFGEGVYAGGGSFEGTVNAFIPGRSGRLVAGEGFARGLGLLLRFSFPPRLISPKLVFRLFRSAGPLNLGTSGSWLVAEVFDRVETLLLLRLRPLRIEPNNERLGASGAGVTVH